MGSPEFAACQLAPPFVVLNREGAGKTGQMAQRYLIPKSQLTPMVTVLLGRPM